MRFVILFLSMLVALPTASMAQLSGGYFATIGGETGDFTGGWAPAVGYVTACYLTPSMAVQAIFNPSSVPLVLTQMDSSFNWSAYSTNWGATGGTISGTYSTCTGTVLGGALPELEGAAVDPVLSGTAPTTPDYGLMASFWGFAFVSTLTLWLISHCAGMILKAIRRG